MDTLGRIRARGDDDFAVDDFDSMLYLLAVGKVRLQSAHLLTRADPHLSQEVLRMHPIAAEIPRIATKDNMLPLAKPIVGVSGKVYDEIPVPTGTVAAFSIMGYNMYVHPLETDRCEDRRVEARFMIWQEQGDMGTGCLRIPTGKVARHGAKARIAFRSLR